MRMTRFLTACLLIISGTVAAQQTTNYYARYEGYACESSIVANLVKVFNNVTGNTQIVNADKSISLLSLAGSMDSEGILRLKEMGKSENFISGAINKDAFTGTIRCENGESDFKMVASYPEGSLSLDVYYLHSEEKLQESNNDSPLAEIELVLIYPEKVNANNNVFDSIEKFIQKSFFNKIEINKNPDSLLADYESDYFSTYKKQNAQWFDNGASFNWQKMVNMSVIHNADYVLCNEYLVYAYTGGAHGMTNIKYDIVSLKTGEKITYSDIFKDNSDAYLSKMLTSKLKANIEINQNARLKENGFFVDTIMPNNNIYVNTTGIGFLYNSYEIAPYSMGQTNIHLKFSEVRDLLKPENPLSELIK